MIGINADLCRRGSTVSAGFFLRCGSRPRAAMAALAAAALWLGLPACASPPDTRYYDLRLDVPAAGAPEDEATGLAPPAGATQPDLGVLVIESVSVPSHLDAVEIFYRGAAFSAGYYNYHEWVRPLSESLAAELGGWLRATGRFTFVAGPADPAPAPGVEPVSLLDVTVLEFAEYSANENEWTAEVRLLLRLRAASGRALHETIVHESAPAAMRNAAGTVAALNRAAAQAAAGVLREIEVFVRR